MSEAKMPTAEQIEKRAYGLYLEPEAKTATLWKIGSPPKES